MKIAVCDDERQVLLDVLSHIAEYRERRRKDISCQVFENAVDLLAAMEREEYDVLFLDVLMSGFNGIQAAREIRQKNERIKIIFLTSSPEFAVESYSVQATNYLLKPATEEVIFPVLDQLVDLLGKPEEMLTVRTQGSVFRIPYRRIEYIEIISRTLYFYLTDGSTRTVHGSLSEYESALLARKDFCKPHRSYIVNLNWVTQVKQGELLTSCGRNIPVARALYHQVRSEYMEFLFEDADRDGCLGMESK